MEKASTPRNRLTRSAAKQVNTPTKDEDQIVAEGIKQNVRNTRTRRKIEMKSKTNGDASADLPQPPSNSGENKKLINSEDVSDGNSLDGYDSENSSTSQKQRASPKFANHKTPPEISRKSLRTRRSITPGPELESSASKKMKRSTSEGKLDSLSTPTKRRNTRARSESKDFKVKNDDCERLMSVSSSKCVATSRPIGTIVEANEGEESSHDDEPLTNLLNAAKLSKEKIHSVKATEESQDSVLKPELKANESSSKLSVTIDQEIGSSAETQSRLDADITTSTSDQEEEKIIKEKENQKKEVGPPLTSPVEHETEALVPHEPGDQASTQLCEATDINFKVETEDENKAIEKNLNSSFSKHSVESTSQQYEKSLKVKQLPQDDNKESNVHEISEEEPYKCDSDSMEIDVTADDSNSQEVSPKLSSMEVKPGHNKSTGPELSVEPLLVSQAKTVTAIENNLPQMPDEIESKSSIEKDIILDSQHVNKEKFSEPLHNKDLSIEVNSHVSLSTSVTSDKNHDNSIVCELDGDKPLNESKVDEDGASCIDVDSKSNLEQEKTMQLEENKVSEDLESKDYKEETSEVDKNKDNKEEIVEVEEKEVYEKKDTIEIEEKEVYEEPENKYNEKETVGESEVASKEIDVCEDRDNHNNKKLLVTPIVESDICNETLDEPVLIEESEDSPVDENEDDPLCCIDAQNEENASCKIEMENSQKVDESKDSEVIHLNLSNDPGDVVQDPLEQNKSLPAELVQVADNICEVYEEVQSAEYKENPKKIKLSDQEVISELESSNKLAQHSQPQFEENYNTEEKTYDEDGNYVQGEDDGERDGEDGNYEGEENYETDRNHEVDKYFEEGKNNVENRNYEEDEKYDGDNNSNEDMKYSENKSYDEGTKSEVKKYEDVKHDQGDKQFYEDNFDDETSNKIEDSASDTDIYKGMFEFGTDGEEKKDGSQFNESASSELRSRESDEYVSSFEGEEDEEDEEENVNTEKLTSNDQKPVEDDQRHNQISDTKDGENPFDADLPMTYDKALAILNKNRVNKIDHEEFFDMFTQELNRVSEASGSDSDIAIVDEYIMEPEEPANKPNKKLGNPQANAKPLQRLPNPLPNQGANLPGQFAGAYPPRHNIPPMPRMNFPQGGMYHHYNQNMPIRGPGMYNQYPPSGQHIPDPRMFHTQIPSDVNFSSNMVNQPVGPVCSETQLYYTNPPPLKVRSVNAMNSSQSFNEMNKNYAGQQPKAIAGLEINTPREQNVNLDNVRCAATMTEANEDLEQSSPSSVSRKAGKNSPSTPILNLLGLDKQKLMQLKQALGIEIKSVHQKTLLTKQKSHQPSLLRVQTTKFSKKPQLDKPRRKERHRAKKAHEKSEKAYKKSLVKQIIDSDSATFTDIKLKGSSDETPSSSDSDVLPTSIIVKDMSSSSSEETFNSEVREINVQDGSVSVTFQTNPKVVVKPRHSLKRVRNSSNETSPKIFKKRKNYFEKQLQNYSSSESLDAKINTNRKMTQKKKQNQKQPTLLKSNCGTFTVDGVTASSQSSESEVPSQDEQHLPGSSKSYLQELQKIRKEIASGKNKLSNMFSQHSAQTNTKGMKRKVEVVLNENKKPGKKEKGGKVAKLPAELLEQLAKEGSKAKRHRSMNSGSDEAVTLPRRKRRKKSSKVKSAAASESYIPCVSEGATQFVLGRLDKATANTLQAAQFRSDQLYGASVKRITTAELMNIMKKKKINETAHKKKIIVKEPKTEKE